MTTKSELQMWVASKTKQDQSLWLDDKMNDNHGLFDSMDNLMVYLCEKAGIDPGDFEFTISVRAKDDE